MSKPSEAEIFLLHRTAAGSPTVYFSVIFIVTYSLPVLLLIPLHSFLFSVFLKIFSSIELYFSSNVARFSILCSLEVVYDSHLASLSCEYLYHHTAHQADFLSNGGSFFIVIRARYRTHRAHRTLPVRARRRAPHRSIGSIQDHRRPSLRWTRASRLRCRQRAYAISPHR